VTEPVRPSATFRRVGPTGWTRPAGASSSGESRTLPPKAHLEQPILHHEPTGLREQYQCGHCNSDVTFYSPIVEIRVGHDPSCPKIRGSI
jgi:hypothetical protein